MSTLYRKPKTTRRVTKPATPDQRRARIVNYALFQIAGSLGNLKMNYDLRGLTLKNTTPMAVIPAINEAMLAIAHARRLLEQAQRELRYVNVYCAKHTTTDSAKPTPQSPVDPGPDLL